MPDFYKPDLGANPDDPFARDTDGKLVRRSYWLDMSDSSVFLTMTSGVGAHIPNGYKRAHLADIGSSMKKMPHRGSASTGYHFAGWASLAVIPRRTKQRSPPPLLPPEHRYPP